MNRQTTLEHIFVNTEAIAVVGLSSSTMKAGYYVPSYLQNKGYRIIPVNPNLESALEEKAYPDLRAVPDSVDLVLIFRRPEHVPPVVDQAIEIGAAAVWMQQGIVNVAAADRAEEAGLNVIMDACMMVEHQRWLPKISGS